MTMALIATAVLLGFATAFRITLAPLRWLHLPTSVIAGFSGLGLVHFGALVSLIFDVGSSPLNPHQEIQSIVSEWKSWPGWLITIVFASMLLAKGPSSTAGAFRRARREGLMVWIIVLGQTTVGLSLVWLASWRSDNIPAALGMLIETGFAGGHGTAAAMGQVFESPQINITDGRDLGVMMATIGLVYGIISGVVWVNLGIRLGWVAPQTQTKDQSTDQSQPLTVDKQETQTASSSSDLDNLLMQMMWLTFALGIGMMINAMVAGFAANLEWLLVSSENASTDAPQLSDLKQFKISQVFGSLPLFIYTLMGGWIVRQVLILLGKEAWIDARMIGRLSSIAMDVLVVSAIASMNIQVISGHANLLIMLVAAAAIWTGFCLLILSKKILPPQHWFELGLINYGMSTGTTATGFVLLRMVDPELRSGAAEDYALATPISSPFVGGGMLTVGIPLFLLTVIPLTITVAALVTLLTVLILIGISGQDQTFNPSAPSDTT